VLDDDGEFKTHPEAIFDREKMKKGNVTSPISGIKPQSHVNRKKTE